MAQLSLFEPESQVLLDDASGRILLENDLLDPAKAQRWFDCLLHDIDWMSGRRQMYQREVEVPRLRAWFSVEQPGLPAVLQEAQEIVAAHAQTAFNSIGLNLYRDQHDSVAPHNDKLADLVRDQPIALLSLGATRRMDIRTKKRPARLLRVDLNAGSLLTMSWNTQLHYNHGIAKQREPVGPRISLAFRVREQLPVAGSPR